MLEGATSIPEFYANRTIFMTGATGFMGKVLLEKLLRSCPQVAKVFILMRPKRGQGVPERLADLLKSRLFTQLHEEQPNFYEKIVAVPGDILEPSLAISHENQEMICREASIVFHSAATVKFDEPLKFSINMNVLGVRRLIELCHKIHKLEALVHVSTAYANCDRDVIMETVYSPTNNADKVIDSIQWMDAETVDLLTPLVIRPRPNTYTFTKALAEHVVQKERGLLPCAIVRPSIVGASWKEPFPGWVDNFNGPSGMLAAIGKGVLRVMHGDTDATADLIPVDVATNLILAASWSLALDRPNGLPVYNCTSGQLNKLTWGQMERHSYQYFMKHPLNAPFRIPDPRFTSSRLKRNWGMFYDHYLPAYVMDFLLWAQGKKPMLIRVQKRLWRSVKTLEYFTSHQWVFTNQNVHELYQKLSKEDQQLFNFDVCKVKWPQYMENYCLGVKKYALNEDMSTVELAKKALYRLLIYRRVFYLLVMALAWRLLMARVTVARRSWQMLLSLASRLIQKIPGFARS